MEARLLGRCLCGKVEFTCDHEPAMAGNCHCRDCQLSSGAAYITALFFPKESVNISGDVNYFEVTSESGNTFSRGFCAHCGSNLFGISSGLPDLVGIRATTLDDPNLFPPTINIFVDSAPSWHTFDESLPTFRRAPN